MGPEVEEWRVGFPCDREAKAQLPWTFSYSQQLWLLLKSCV